MTTTHSAATGQDGVRDAGSTDPGATSTPAVVPAGTPSGHSPEFDAHVESIRRRLVSLGFIFHRTEQRFRRLLGLSPFSPPAVIGAGLFGAGARLVLALVATALAGDMAAIPWGRWIPVLAFYGVFDATQAWRTPPPDVPMGPRVRRMVDDWTALLPTISDEASVRDLDGFLRRRLRLSWTVLAGAAVVTTIFAYLRLVAPAALAALPAGTLVLLALVVFDVGPVIVYEGMVQMAFWSREARYDHDLFWPSPVDSPEVQKAIRMNTVTGVATGVWTTIYLILAVVLVSWSSPLVLPLAVAFLVICYLTTVLQVISVRGSIQTIVERARRRRLQGLQNRIAAFGSRYDELSPDEWTRLRGLLDLHNMVRDAPSTPTAAHTLVRAAVGLIIPSLLFVVTVFGEVYAERILDSILP